MRVWLTLILLGLWLLATSAGADHSTHRAVCLPLEEALSRAYGSLNAQGKYVGPQIPEGSTPEETAVIIADWEAARTQAITDAKAALLACEQAQ